MSDALARCLVDEFQRFALRFNTLLNTNSASNAASESLGEVAQRELLPYLLLTRNAERWYSKPRGYAGDFLTIQGIYDDQATGWSRLGPVLDRCFLDLPAARAVRNRRALLSGEIMSTMENDSGKARITSLACGPAQEVFDVFSQLDDPQRLHATLVDLDQEALRFVENNATRNGLNAQMRLHRYNLLRLVVGRRSFDLPEQDLIYSVGLIDYFNDDFVVKLLDWIHQKLARGGRVILGNFHPCNPSRAMMDHVLDWRLIHRDETHMNRLFEASAFGRCGEIRREPEGVNLFVSARKE